jgi:hypothetical protein
MKDLRGFHAAAVQNAILLEFGLQIPTNSRKKHVKINISEWKRLREVEEYYDKLYDDDENVIENIAKLAFPTLSHDDVSLFNDIYVYKASVCDIILNPDHPYTECAKKTFRKTFSKI